MGISHMYSNAELINKTKDVTPTITITCNDSSNMKPKRKARAFNM